MIKEIKKNVAVFFGGKSVEHDISIITGLQTINSLNPFKFNVVPIYINKQGVWLTGENLKSINEYKNLNYKKVKKVCLLPDSNFLFSFKGSKLKKVAEIDYIINCMHGLNGEDGFLAGVVRQTNIIFCSPDIKPSAISMDKAISKYIFKSLGLNVLPFISFDKQELIENKESIFKKINEIGYPIVVKPCNLGSSIGISFCNNSDEAEKAIETAFCFDHLVVIERGLTEFSEYNCSALGLSERVETSEIERPEINGKILTFNSKYTEKTKREFPAKIGKKLKNELQKQTALIYKELGCSGVIRVDFMFDEKESKLYINEANLVPGSLAFYLWKGKYTYSQLIEKLIEDATLNYNRQSSKVTSFNSNALEYFEKGCNKLK